jgi:RimJ/RimL family protein N-acetyltransferase
VRATGKGLSWAVAAPETDAILGSVGIFDLTDDLAYGEIGYWTHPDARGRGVMSTAVALVLEHAFEVLGLRRVKAYTARDNAASRHVLEICGMTEHGVERLGAVVAGGRVDSILYDVLREEWARRTNG